jgi:hypothetical protein
VQRLAIPIEYLGRDIPAAVASGVRDIAAEIERLAAVPPVAGNRLEELRRRHRGSSWIPELYELWNRVDSLLADAYLDDVSISVRRKVIDAMRAWRDDQSPPASTEAYSKQFAALAPLLIRHDDVIRAIADEPFREV